MTTPACSADSAKAKLRRRRFMSLALMAGIAAGHSIVGCGGDEETPSRGTGGDGPGAGGGGTAGSTAGGTAGAAGSANPAGQAGDAGDGGSVANGGTAGSGGSGGVSARGGASGATGQAGEGSMGGEGGISIAECRECIAENAELGPVQAEYCDTSAECIAAQDCVLDADCYVPIPAACYCGPDIDNCSNSDFTPTGVCAEEIRAGTGNPADNATVLERFFDWNYPTGVGMLIIDEASRMCAMQCFP